MDLITGVGERMILHSCYLMNYCIKILVLLKLPEDDVFIEAMFVTFCPSKCSTGLFFFGGGGPG